MIPPGSLYPKVLPRHVVTGPDLSGVCCLHQNSNICRPVPGAFFVEKPGEKAGPADVGDKYQDLPAGAVSGPPAWAIVERFRLLRGKRTLLNSY